MNFMAKGKATAQTQRKDLTRRRESGCNERVRFSSSRLFPEENPAIRFSGIQIAIQDAKKKAKYPLDAFFVASRLRVRPTHSPLA
jgi:hypothetical protein